MNSISRNFGYSILGAVIPGILSFLFIPAVVNLYSEAVYAQYSLVINALNVIVLFCYGWVGQSYIRFYSRFNGGFYQIALQLLGKSLLVAMPLFVAAELLFAGADWISLLLLLPAFFLAGRYNFFILSCQAQQQTIWIALSETIRACINITLPLLLHSISAAGNAFLILVFSFTLAHLLPLLLFASRAGSRRNGAVIPGTEPASDYTIKRQVLQYGIPVAVFLSFALALSVNDRFLIARLIGYEAAGKYASLYDIINRSVTVGCAPVLMTFYPQVARLYNQHQQQAAYRLLVKALIVELALFAVGFILLFFLGIWAMNILFHREVPQSDLNLMLLIYIGVFFWQFAMLLHKKLELQLHTRLMAFGVVIAFLFNFMANIWLLYRFNSIVIAAITTIAASVLYIVFVLIVSRRGIIASYKVVH